jgi:anti-sigma B factor antagonist
LPVLSAQQWIADEGAVFVLFDVQRTTLAGRPALTVRGELDLLTAPELAAAVDAQLAAAPSSLVVDLTGTSFLDSSGARELVRSARAAAAAGVALHVVVPPRNGPVRLTVDLLDLGTVVPIVGSVAEVGFGERDART